MEEKVTGHVSLSLKDMSADSSTQVQRQRRTKALLVRMRCNRKVGLGHLTEASGRLRGPFIYNNESGSNTAAMGIGLLLALRKCPDRTETRQ